MTSPDLVPPSHASRGQLALLAAAIAALVALVLVLVLSQRGDDEQAAPAEPTSAPSISSERISVPERGGEPLPGPVGFAEGTTGGAGGRLYVVTSGNDSPSDPAPGTLRHALAQPGPRWIVFDDDLVVEFAEAMEVPSDSTIDGRGHAVTFTGFGQAGLQVYDARNVIVTDIAFDRFGDTALTEENDPDDAIDVRRSSQVFIDHNRFSRIADKAISVEDGGAGVTVSWNHVVDQEQVMQIGALATADADTAAAVTVHHNFFDRVGYRLPMVGFGRAHVYNNFLDRWTVSGVRSQLDAQVFLEANVFRPGESPRAVLTEPAQVCNDDGSLCDDRPGKLRSVGNQVIGNGFINTASEDEVFAPSDSYDYVADAPDEAMAQHVAESAGPRD